MKIIFSCYTGWLNHLPTSLQSLYSIVPGRQGKTRLTYTLALALAGIVAASCASAEYVEKLERAEKYMYTDYERAIKIAEEVMKSAPELPDPLWIKSISYTNLSDMASRENQRQLYLGKAEELADKALRLAPDQPNANHAKAIVLGRKAEQAGPREGLRLSREIKRYSDQVLELDEKHAGAWFVRGMLIYRIDTLGRIERWIANTLFGGLPFEADQDRAVAAIGKAIELEPENIYFRLEYGRILKAYGRNSQARRILRKTLNLEPVSPKDPDYLKEVNDLLDGF